MAADTRVIPPGGTRATDAARTGRRTPVPGGFLVLVLVLMVVEAAAVAAITWWVARPAAGPGHAAGDLEYLDLGEIYATLPADAAGQTSRYFRVQVAAGIGGDNRADVRERIEKLRPRIQDEIQSILLKETYPQVRQPEAKKRIAAAILAALNAIVGPGSVHEVALPRYEPQ